MHQTAGPESDKHSTSLWLTLTTALCLFVPLSAARPSLQHQQRPVPLSSSAAAVPLQSTLPELSAYRGLPGPGPSPLRSAADSALSALDPWGRYVAVDTRTYVHT